MGYLSNKLVDSNNLGYFATEAALIAAYPVGFDGAWAIVGETDSIWVWDDTTGAWVDTGGGSGGSVNISGTPVTNDFARWTNATTIEGRSYSEARTDLGLVIGTNVQAWDTHLDDIAGLVPASSLIIGDGLGSWTKITPANFITDNNILDTADIGVSIQAWDTHLDDIAGLVPASSLIIGDGLGGWTLITPANFITDNNILDTADIGVSVQAHDAVLDATTASFLIADETKLDAIEALADVTDEANVSVVASVVANTAKTGVTTEISDIVEDTTPQIGGELDSGAHSIGFTMQTATGDGTTTVDWKLGNHIDFTFGAFNETFTFTAPSKTGVYTMGLKQDSVGSRTATWPATVKWPDGTAPTLTTTATTGYDIISFRYDGTNYYSVASLDFS